MILWNLLTKSAYPWQKAQSQHMIMLGSAPIVLQEALQGGLMSAAELRQWLALAARPILGALSRYPHNILCETRRLARQQTALHKIMIPLSGCHPDGTCCS